MVMNLGKGTDASLTEIEEALRAYETEYASITREPEFYRQNPGSIRIRIIDRRFEGMSRSRRHDEVWEFLSARVGEDTMSQISLLLLLPPGETGRSLMNFEFEDPARSEL